LLLLGGIFVGLLALGDMLPSIYTPSFIYKLLGFIGISLLLITLCVCFGLFASVMTRHSNVSLLICVSFWLFGTIIIPNSATFWGYTLYPTPLLRDIAQEVEAKESQLTKEAPPGSMAQQSENPFYPYHERRAILWMKKKEVREKSYRDYYECLIRQFEGVRRLTLLSPTVQYERAMEALLGGGHLRFQKNWRDLQAFQLTFLAWFKQKDAEDPESPHWYNPYEDVSTSRKSFDIKEAPRYQERDIAQEVEAKESQLTKEAPPGSMAQQSENPFYPYHERRAILWMKKKEVREKSYRDYYECLIRQFEGVRRLTLLSPTVQYERAMEALLGGGHLRFQKNWRDLQAFQLTFLAWFKQKDAEDPESPHWYNPYEDVSTSRKSFDIKEAPRYQERSVPLKERLALIGLYALTTFFFIALLVWGGFRLLEKYDVR
uniref:ABC transporter permease n=1 Tax=Parabacteroides distasonis TaxID=823 RepID=UPI004029D105